MKPFILIEVEDNSVSETTVVGDTQVVPIVIDWDTLEPDLDPGFATEMIDEIMGRYTDGESIDDSVDHVLCRLRAIVNDNTEEEDYEEEQEDLDDDDELDEDEDEDEDDDMDGIDDDDEPINEDENPHRRDDKGGRVTPLELPVFPTPGTVEEAEFGPDPGPLF